MIREEHKQRILKRCRKLLAEFEQMVRDVEWWNANRTEHPPMDCEPEKVLASLYRQYIPAFEREDWAESDRLRQRITETALALQDEIDQ